MPAERRVPATVSNYTASGNPLNVASSATTVTLFPANPERLWAHLFNDSASYLYIKLGATASATSFNYKVEPQGTWELPIGVDGTIYEGIIDGIWSTASGFARTGEGF
jgi:hypothetical protein